MKDLLVVLAHLLTRIAKLLGAGGMRAVVADSLLMNQQRLVYLLAHARGNLRGRSVEEVSLARKPKPSYRDVFTASSGTDCPCRLPQTLKWASLHVPPAQVDSTLPLIRKRARIARDKASMPMFRKAVIRIRKTARSKRMSASALST